MKNYLLVITTIFGMTFTSYKDEKKPEGASVIIGQGQMPNATNDNKGNIHIVFGTGDSIMYSSSINRGKSFSKPALISILPNLAASAMRGPQIAATSNGLIIIACNKKGDIFSYRKNGKNW